ncbi:MAG: septum formation protein Maf [Bacteroidales bacterium]|nr:septum formation protein Maf [Candidatus Colimorpha pelethequi]
MIQNINLLLASKSPRRRQLLGDLGLPISFVELDVDETITENVPAEERAEYLAKRKAAAYESDKLVAGQVLVTADTVVVMDSQVLGKPKSRQEALAMLHGLSGKKHVVYTGMCLKTATESISFTEATSVWFKELSDSEIEYYIDTYKPFDKAGSYGIQEWIGMIGIEKIEGCFYNVMGLPVARFYEKLKQIS